MPVQFNTFLQLLTKSNRISEVISPFLLFIIIHFLNCHLYFYCVQEEEVLWLPAGVLGLLKHCVSSPVSVERPFNAQCQCKNSALFYSLFQLTVHSSKSLICVDMCKVQEKGHKPERLLCLQWWVFKVTAPNTISSFPNQNCWEEPWKLTLN